MLGLAIGTSEAEVFWTDFLRKLARRGLRGVKLVVSDAHEGLKAAVAKVLNASWQRCRVHFMRNVLAHAGKQGRRVVLAFIGTAFAQDDAEAARTQWRQVADQLRPKVRKLAELMDEAEATCWPIWPFRRPTGPSCTHKPDRTAERRNQAPHRCRRHLPPYCQAITRLRRRDPCSSKTTSGPCNAPADMTLETMAPLR